MPLAHAQFNLEGVVSIERTRLSAHIVVIT